jgi:hypothetical protein
MTNASLINSFDRVRIINMKTRADRRVETEQEFARHGFGMAPPRVGFFEAVTPTSAEGFPNAGVRGCFLSHLGILEGARADGQGNVLILEDDIAFTRDIKDAGREAVTQLAGLDWDIAYFGHAKESVPGPVSWQRVREPMLLAHFYAVNGQALAPLVDFLHTVLSRPPGHPDGGPMHYDGALSTFIKQNPEVKAYYCSRNLGYQRPSKTDLHRTSVIDRNPFLRPFASLYRAAKRAYLKRIR